MEGTTGNKCKKSGRYYCSEHKSKTIKIQEGDTFPPCQDSDHGATWIMIYENE